MIDDGGADDGYRLGVQAWKKNGILITQRKIVDIICLCLVYTNGHNAQYDMV